jgi:hypothetical protein
MPEDRDRLFEKALARHLRSDAAVDRACLDAEALAAYHDRLLSPEEMATANSHLVSCPDCQEILAQLEITQQVHESQDQASEVLLAPAAGAQRSASNMAHFPARKTSLLRWATPAGAIAAAVLIWIGVRDYRASRKGTASAVEMAENRRDAAPAPEFPSPGSPPVAKQKNEIAPREEYRQQRVAPPTDMLHDEVRQSRVAAEPQANSSADRKLAAPAASPPPKIAGGAAGPVGGRVPADIGGISAEKKKDFDASDKAVLDATKTSPDLPDREINSRTVAGGLPAAPSPAAPAPSRGKAAAPSAPAASSIEVAAQSVLNKEENQPTQFSYAVSTLKLLSFTAVAPDGKDIWRFGEHGAIAHSSDGGSTWESQFAPLTSTLTSGSAPSKKVCWIAGAMGALLRTTDRGKHWQVVIHPITADLGGVHATDDKHATIWDAGNRLRYETSDGGVTWKPTANE